MTFNALNTSGQLEYHLNVFFQQRHVSGVTILCISNSKMIEDADMCFTWLQALWYSLANFARCFTDIPS